jgi:hypothetical protein
MKCPFCLAQCLASDSWCPACRRSLGVERAAPAKSAMWLCIPLFMLFGAALFVGLLAPPPHPSQPRLNWTLVNQTALVSLGSALLGAVVGWVLDFIARK